MTPTSSTETSSETLARSAFGFAFFALIPAVITWVLFWLAPPSPDPTFRTIRWVIIVSFGLFLLFLLWVTRYFYRTPQEKLLPFAEHIASILGSRWLAVILIVALVEINLLAFFLLEGIAASITNPAKFLMLCWSLLFIGIVFTVHRTSISQRLEQTKSIWVAVGIVMVSAVFMGVLLFINGWLVRSTGINDMLRGGLDYRHLEFYDDGNETPSAPEFWAEQSQTTVRWSPYTYWVMTEFAGDFINISSDGLRESANFGGENEIFVFGGSTVWGEGARDDYTIPSHLARLLDENNTPQQVVNYGQTGYVSSQDLIWFQLQLVQGNVPDVAIFYQGFNDVLSAWGADFVGVSLQESMRLNDSEAGRILRYGQPLLQLPNLSLDIYDMSGASVFESTPQAIADRWFANVDMIDALANAYGAEVLFVWQPAIILKDTLSENEQSIYERTENERAGLLALYAEVDTIVRARVTSDGYDNIIVLSDLFAENSEPIFHDLVHITEIGNGFVAEAIFPYVSDLLE